MLPILDNLSAELLLKTANFSDSPREVHENLRAVCKTVGYKIVRNYGKKWYRDVNVSLDATNLTKLQAISCGDLTVHV
jgi:hypothetical protein